LYPLDISAQTVTMHCSPNFEAYTRKQFGPDASFYDPSLYCFNKLQYFKRNEKTSNL